MPTYTLTYDDGVKGFPSFYTYYPDWIQGMNNYLYTFKGGNLYRHNTNEIRNNYYGEDFSSILTSVFNDQPLENKLFKTLDTGNLPIKEMYKFGGAKAGSNYDKYNFTSEVWKLY